MVAADNRLQSGMHCGTGGHAAEGGLIWPLACYLFAQVVLRHEKCALLVMPEGIQLAA